MRLICDELLGRDRFLNEIVWRRALNLEAGSLGPVRRTLDTLIVYGASAETRLVPPERLVVVPRCSARRSILGRWFTELPRAATTDASVVRLEAEGRVHRTSSGAVAVKYWLRGRRGATGRRRPDRRAWIDISSPRHAASQERTGYPTQKPRALLERIVAAASPEGGLVVDLFGGLRHDGAPPRRGSADASSWATPAPSR